MRLAGTIVAGLLVLTATAGGLRAEGNAEKGRALAEKYCARCHVVGAGNRLGGIDSTPSFPLLARRADYLERFRTFFARRPHPVYVRVPEVPPPTDLPPYAAVFEISLADIEDIVAFVETIRAKEGNVRASD